MLVQHHIKYKEIHGVDEIVMMEKREHKALHKRLRKEGKCNIPIETLTKISTAAHRRTSLYTAGNRQRSKEYSAKNRISVRFQETVGVNVRLIEEIKLNKLTGNLCVISCFRADHGHDLVRITEG